MDAQYRFQLSDAIAYFSLSLPSGCTEEKAKQIALSKLQQLVDERIGFSLDACSEFEAIALYPAMNEELEIKPDSLSLVDISNVE